MPRAAPKATPRRAASAGTRAFLFSDLRGYTDFVERKGDAAAARLLRDYRTLVRREVARHAGAEVKTEGDSFYVVFDSASAALECAVAVLRRAETRNENEPAAPLEIGVGVHAGETVAFDKQFVGSAVNVASRLASQAGVGELLVSDTFRGLVRTSTEHPMTERGVLQLKGVSEGIRAWSVTWREPRAGPTAPAASAPLPAALAGPAPGQLVCPVVVGRDAERARAAELLDAAHAGRGQTLLVGGEAGVGKSAYVRDVTARAVERGFRILYGATLESDGGLPYAPFLTAVRSGFRGLERERLGRILSQAAPDLAELFPELGRAARTAPPAEGAEQSRLALAFHGLFATFAREAPTLLVIEDLHWSDEASLALLHYLARELRDARVLILASYRSDEMHRRHPFLRVLATLQRERLVGEVRLERLDPEQVRELIRATFATSEPDVRITDPFRDAIYARSEGNPFFTEELLKSLVESGGVYFEEKTGWARKPIEELKIPGSIREAVRERVERLSVDARATLAVAAVIGLQFGFDALRGARGLGEADIEQHLREAIEQQLVVELAGDDRYAFRHALTKEVVYDDLLVRERKRLHRAVGDALAGDPRAEPALVAHHLLAAGESERALPHVLAAADRALAAGAPREAAAHYGRAIEIGPPDAQLAAVIERQADAYHAFDVALSIKAAGEAAELYRQRGDPRGGSRMLRLAGRGHFYESREDEAARLTQAAIDVLEGEECPELGRAIAQQATLLMARGHFYESLPLAERAIDLGQRLGDPWTVANALITKGSALRDPEASLPPIRAGLEVAKRHALAETAMRGYNNAALRMIATGATAAEKLAFLAEGIAHGRRYGLERATMAYLLSQQEGLEFGRGDWDAALATADVVETGSLVHRWSLALRATVITAREGPEAALPVYVGFARSLGGSREVRELAELAMGYVQAGRLDDARAYLARLAEAIASIPASTPTHFTLRFALGGPALRQLVIAALAVDDTSWLDLAESEIAMGPLGDANRFLLRSARAVFAGDAAQAAEGLDAAYALFERVGFAGYWHEYAIGVARIGAARGLPLGPEWRPILERVRAFATKVGARWWLAEVDRLMPVARPS